MQTAGNFLSTRSDFYKGLLKCRTTSVRASISPAPSCNPASPLSPSLSIASPSVQEPVFLRWKIIPWQALASYGTLWYANHWWQHDDDATVVLTLSLLLSRLGRVQISLTLLSLSSTFVLRQKSVLSQRQHHQHVDFVFLLLARQSPNKFVLCS